MNGKSHIHRANVRLVECVRHSCVLKQRKAKVSLFQILLSLCTGSVYKGSSYLLCIECRNGAVKWLQCNFSLREENIWKLELRGVNPCLSHIRREQLDAYCHSEALSVLCRPSLSTSLMRFSIIGSRFVTFIPRPSRF